MQSKLNFRYRCQDRHGKERTGTVAAHSTSEAAEALKLRGWSLQELTPEGGRRPGPAPPQGHAPEPAPRVSARQLNAFTAQLITLLEGGLPLLRGLETLTRGSEPAVQDLCQRLARRLEAGSSLSQALALWPELFDPTYVASVRLGETTGRLLFVLRRLADSRMQQSERQDRLRAALTYPIFLACSCLAMLVFLISVLLPQLVKLVPEGSEPPWPTRVVIALSQLPLIPITVFLVVAATAAAAQLRAPEGRPWRDWLLYGPFPWSEHFLQVLWVDLARSLELMFTSGVAAAQIIPCLMPSAGPRLRLPLQLSQERFCQGHTLGEALEPEPGVPRLLIQLLQVGESVGKIEVFLRMFADLYESELEGQREACLTLIEPLLLVSLGGVVGFVVMASFLPAYQLVMTQ